MVDKVFDKNSQGLLNLLKTNLKLHKYWQVVKNYLPIFFTISYTNVNS